MKVGMALTAVVVVLCAVLLSDGTGPNATGELAYYPVSLFGLAALILIWIGVLFAWIIRVTVRDHRRAKRFAKPS